MNELHLSPDLQRKLEEVLNSSTHKLSEIAKIAGFDLAKDYIGADLSGANLSEDNLRNANLSGTDLRNANLSGALINLATNFEQSTVMSMIFGGQSSLNPRIKEELIRKGAVFRNDDDLMKANLKEALINRTTNLEKTIAKPWYSAGRSSIRSSAGQSSRNPRIKKEPVSKISPSRILIIESVFLAQPHVAQVEIVSLPKPDTKNRHRMKARRSESYKKSKEFYAVIVLEDNIKATEQFKTTLKKHVQREIGINYPFEILFAETLPEKSSDVTQLPRQLKPKRSKH